MRRPRPPPAGFTLLETLVAVTLLGLLSVALFGAVRAGSQGWHRAEQRRATTQDTVAIQDILRHIIAAAVPLFASSNPEDPAIAFDGTPEALGLIGTLPEAIAPGLQGQQRLFLGQHDGAPALMFAWRLDLPAPDGGPLPENVVPLLDHVHAVHFAYYAAASGWTDTWSARAALPELVRLRLERDDPAASVDVVAAPMATVSNECRYTGLGATCHRAP